MSTQHTPGPWKVEPLGERRVLQPRDQVIRRTQGNRVGAIAFVYAENWPNGQDQANARLIAAAPELLTELRAAHEIIQVMLLQMSDEQKLAALREMERRGHHPDHGLTRYAARSAVIAKVEGQP